MSDAVPIIAWGLRTTLPRSTWFIYFRFMLVDNYLVVGQTDMKTGQTMYSLSIFEADWEAQERAVVLTEGVERDGYLLVEEPLQHPIDLEAGEWLGELNVHRDKHRLLDMTYQHIRDLGRPLG